MHAAGPAQKPPGQASPPAPDTLPSTARHRRFVSIPACALCRSSFPGGGSPPLRSQRASEVLPPDRPRVRACEPSTQFERPTRESFSSRTALGHEMAKNRDGSLPIFRLPFHFFAPGARQRIEFGATAVFRGTPLRRHETFLLKLQKRRV